MNLFICNPCPSLWHMAIELVVFLYGWFPKTIFVNIHYPLDVFQSESYPPQRGGFFCLQGKLCHYIHQDLPFLSGGLFKFARQAGLFVSMHLIGELAEIMSNLRVERKFHMCCSRGCSLTPSKKEGNYWNPATVSPPSGNTLILGLGCYPREKALCGVTEDSG
jgi:hypothetical protein